MPPNGRTTPLVAFFFFIESLPDKMKKFEVFKIKCYFSCSHPCHPHECLVSCKFLSYTTQPLICTHFDSCQSPRFPLRLRLSRAPCRQGRRPFSPNRAEKVSGVFIHFPQTKAQIATQMLIRSKKASPLPVRSS